MKITSVDTRDGEIVLGVEDGDKTKEITLKTIEAAQLLGALRASIAETVEGASAYSTGLPGMERVQIYTTESDVFFRVYMSDRIYHEYPVPKNTSLADELKLLADRVETRYLAKAIYPPHGSHSGKN